MSTITWLHLSDLHFRQGEQHEWDEDIVLRKFLDDVQERIDHDGLALDFVVVTGDIAFSGAGKEYALASQFLDEALAATGLGKDRLFVVDAVNARIAKCRIVYDPAKRKASLDPENR